MAHDQYSYVRIHAYFAVMFIITSLLVLIRTPVVVVSSLLPIRDQNDPSLLSALLLPIDHETKLCKNTSCIKNASSDYGNIVKQRPLGVLYPSSVSDISSLVESSYNSSSPFTIAAHGNGHSVRGQAMAKNGVVVEMASLNTTSDDRIMVTSTGNSSVGYYADVGGEQLWIDVLRATLNHGLAPVSWTDYLYLTVGGTLSNAGISGQASFHGPQISNVLEMDVITGKGNIITCSKNMNSDLFYAVLGGLGQFGIITRARIVLDKAPTRVKWIRIIYDDFSSFTKDQEHLISSTQQHTGSTLFDYVEGSLIVDTASTNNFYSLSDASKINSFLASSNNTIFTLEAVKYYHNDDDPNINTTAIIDEELERILDRVLNLKSRLLTFKKDVSFFDFLNRLGNADDDQEKPKNVRRHPWLNLFVPISRITDFNQGVFVEILQKQQGPYLVYPINRKRWDDRMSVVIPDDDEDMFYTVGLLHSTEGDDDWSKREEQNKEILEFCDKNDIKIKQYFPSYTKKEDWMKHFGKKWDIFQQRKNQFDPKMILSPGQRIFSSD